jgi:hypothetical protein
VLAEQHDEWAVTPPLRVDRQGTRRSRRPNRGGDRDRGSGLNVRRGRRPQPRTPLDGTWPSLVDLLAFTPRVAVATIVTCGPPLQTATSRAAGARAQTRARPLRRKMVVSFASSEQAATFGPHRGEERPTRNGRRRDERRAHA